MNISNDNSCYKSLQIHMGMLWCKFRQDLSVHLDKGKFHSQKLLEHYRVLCICYSLALSMSYNQDDTWRTHWYHCQYHQMGQHVVWKFQRGIQQYKFLHSASIQTHTWNKLFLSNFRNLVQLLLLCSPQYSPLFGRTCHDQLVLRCTFLLQLDQKWTSINSQWMYRMANGCSFDQWLLSEV
jgi:hypothetical protein